MGAFFLFDKKAKLQVNDVEVVFKKKGFQSPKIFDLGDSILLLYRKQLIDEDNYITDGMHDLFITGTIVYKGKNYTETKQELLNNIINNTLDKDEIIGNYCLIYFDGIKITLMNDSMNVYHLFTNQSNEFISSSFLAAMAAQPDKLKINKMALYEKLTTGYIVGKDTLFEQIIHITRTMKKNHINQWKFIHMNSIDIDIDFHDNGLKKSANHQVNMIIEYLKAIQSLAEQYRANLGLSGGYDSRLLYAATFKSWPLKIAVHTHATEGVAIHNIEKQIVKDMTDVKESELTIYPTKNMNSYNNDEIKEILKDGLYFFDGRCAYNMGAFSTIYTRKYKINVVGNNRLTLNGLGGEMYRNYYMVFRPLINVKEWMKAHIYCNRIEDVFNEKNIFEKMHHNISNKMTDELGFSWRGMVSNYKMRRYYSDLRMPDCDALNCNAHNQLEFYLTPFIEQSLIKEAYKGYKYIGLSGEYQSEIIRQLDSELSTYKSHYGFTFSAKEPLKYKIYMLIRGLLPDRLWNARVNIINKKKGNENNNLMYFQSVVEKCNYLKNASIFAERILPEINFDILRCDYAMMPNSTYVSILLYEFRDKLEIY